MDEKINRVWENFNSTTTLKEMKKETKIESTIKIRYYAYISEIGNNTGAFSLDIDNAPTWNTFEFAFDKMNGMEDYNDTVCFTLYIIRGNYRMNTSTERNFEMFSNTSRSPDFDVSKIDVLIVENCVILSRGYYMSIKGISFSGMISTAIYFFGRISEIDYCKFEQNKLGLSGLNKKIFFLFFP